MSWLLRLNLHDCVGIQCENTRLYVMQKTTKQNIRDEKYYCEAMPSLFCYLEKTRSKT